MRSWLRDSTNSSSVFRAMSKRLAGTSARPSVFSRSSSLVSTAFIDADTSSASMMSTPSPVMTC
jgi:hypothetical protein